MGSGQPDVDALEASEVKRLLVEAFEKISALMAENAALREEIARLKGLKGKPDIKPARSSGMEQATDGQSGRERRAKTRNKGANPLAVHEERIIKADDLPAGSRFKGYEHFSVHESASRRGLFITCGSAG